jgi:hypothetical protein
MALAGALVTVEYERGGSSRGEGELTCTPQTTALKGALELMSNSGQRGVEGNVATSWEITRP